MSEEWISGWVLRMQSGFDTVKLDQPAALPGRNPGSISTVVCHLRGRLKRARFDGDVIAVGDRVKVSLLADGSGMIEEIEPRERELARMSPTPRGEYRQILLANPDQVMMVFSCAQPEPRLRMLDRFLVICEKAGIRACIVANKVDLLGLEQAQEIFGAYPSLGYPVIYTSVKQKMGLDELRQALAGRISGLAGPSGVGKSSLLNAIQPELGLAVRSVSAMTAKGRHTTVVRQLFELNEGGFVADLPGLKSLALWDTEPEELDGYFPEMRYLVEECQYNDCTHRGDPGCAVKKAVEEGRVSAQRYESYLRMRYGEEED